MNETIYHYCSIKAFEEIIKNRTIWYSDLRRMNDPDEYALGYCVVREAILGRHPYAQSLIEDIKPDFLGDKYEILICSFSHNGDCLSLWRAYAEYARGVALGFSPERLFTGNLVERYCQKMEPVTGGTEIIPVIYDETVFRERIEAQLRRWRFPEGEEERRKDVRLTALRHELMRLCAVFKSRSYSDEREIRSLIVNSIESDEYHTGTRDGKYGKTKYHELNTCFGEQNYVTEVVLGPKNSYDCDTVQRSLAELGLTSVTVRNSEVKYR